MIRDEEGNRYGTTAQGGLGNGVVFKVDPTGKETVLYEFTGGTDGSQPFASVVRDSAGNLFGTTFSGGAAGYGVVFKLDPSGKETVLYSFTGGTDGSGPQAGVVLDAAGNLYGTTSAGGDLVDCNVSLNQGCGVVFKLDPSGKETVLYAFPNGGPYGFTRSNPAGNLIVDQAGNLYGTVARGGNSGSGIVFKVDKSGKESTLYNFTGGSDGANPIGGLATDEAGSVYKLAGTSFENAYVFPSSRGGTSPDTTLVRDSAGNLYGSTSDGGAFNQGVVYRLDQCGRETVLHFTGGADGGG